MSEGPKSEEARIRNAATAWRLFETYLGLAVLMAIPILKSKSALHQLAWQGMIIMSFMTLTMLAIYFWNRRIIDNVIGFALTLFILPIGTVALLVHKAAP